MPTIRDIQFDPTKQWNRKRNFVVIDKQRQHDGINRLKAELESEMCTLIPAKYRKYVKRYMKMKEPPEQCEIGWIYSPEVEVIHNKSKIGTRR